jgi:hypothetical protein
LVVVRAPNTRNVAWGVVSDNLGVRSPNAPSNQGPAVPALLRFSAPLVACLLTSAFLVTACGDSEGGSGGSSGDGGSTSTSTSTGQGGGAAAVCSGDELEDCLTRCDYLNSCADAATQQACRDICPTSTPKACVDYDACSVQDFACENALDCWDVFRKAPTGATTTTGGGNTGCSTACANVADKCGGEGGIDYATCLDQCASYSQSAITCATNAANCDAVLSCVGAGGG